MRILWVSNAPWFPTGYGQQTNLFAPRLLRLLGHEVIIQAFSGLQGANVVYGGLPVYPAVAPDWGQTDLSENWAAMKIDLAVSLMDVWVCRPEMYAPAVRWAPWFPVDHEPLPPPVLRALQGGDVDEDKRRPPLRRIVYSQFGERMCAEAGLETRYVPHGVDTAVFCPGDKKAARERMGFPQDRFIVGMVAANKGGGKGFYPRKAFPQQIEAMGRFHVQHPDAYLFLHTQDGLAGPDTVNLPELIVRHGLQDAVGFPQQHHLGMGAITDRLMADVYRSFDVLLSVSMGEGFGVPILEAQACGTPVIVGDWTSMSELKWHGWAVDKADALPVWTPMASYQFIPRVEAILERLEAAYNWRGGTPERLKDVIATYDADWITRTYWKPVLDEIAADLGLPETVEPSKRLVLPTNGTVPPGIDGLNRAQRRQLARVK